MASGEGDTSQISFGGGVFLMTAAMVTLDKKGETRSGAGAKELSKLTVRD